MATNLGDSGISWIPIPRIIAQMMPIPITVLHEPDPSMLRVPMEIRSVQIMSEIPRRKTKVLTGDEDTKCNE
jgi:hypothetical protein